MHNRESTDDMVEILSRTGGARAFSTRTPSRWTWPGKLVDLGYYISFSGIVTFKSAESLREAARGLPHDRVLIETDTPYLAPVPYRGRDNEPAYVVADRGAAGQAVGRSGGARGRADHGQFRAGLLG